MTICDGTTLKRSVLLGARIRFSPTGASVRNQAIERIIEQNLASAETAKGLTEQELQHLVTLGGQFSMLRAADLRQGIDSLKHAGRVLNISGGKQPRYILSETARTEVDRVTAEAEERTKKTIKELFRNAFGGEDAYGRAFILLLCKLFSELSEVYVQVITRKQGHLDLAEHRLLFIAIEETLKSERVPDDQAFRYGVNRFFRESTPQFDQIKWNMAQNFYIAKALGISDSSDLLSTDIFKDAALFCDTNVLIAGLSPESRHYSSFQALAKSCGTIGMNLNATRITLEELRRVIDDQNILLRRVIDRIPEETRPKIRNFLLEAYLSEKAKCDSLSLDDFYVRFQTPLQTLKDSFGVSEVDDVWFDKAFDDPETKKLSIDLSNKYKLMRGRPKSESASLHDALLVRYVSLENIKKRKSWIITLDITLAEWNVEKKIQGSNIITLDAFLQWMGPVTPGTNGESKFSSIFAEAIRNQLFPRDTFFQLRDFHVFAEMEIDTKQLPAEDVEACIREIKQTGPLLDPSKAEDREKLGTVIQRYFADPGTKHKRIIEELQTKSKNLSQELAKEKQMRTEAEKRVQELNLQTQEMSNQIENGQDALSAAILRIDRLEEKEKDEQQKRLMISAIRRTALSFSVLVLVELLILYLVRQYGVGANLFQKLTNSWTWPCLGFAIVAVLYPFFMGRERMRLLKWWKGETD